MRSVRRVASKAVVRARARSRPELGELGSVLDQFLDFNGGYFIEVGANDGYQQSNTYVLEKSRGWTGLLVEAMPELAERCARRRPKSRVVNCALVSDDFAEATVTMRFADLMSLVDGAQGDRNAESAHIAQGISAQHLASTFEEEVSARTLTSVLNDAEPRSVDFFSLDVEGYELNVLRGFDLNRIRPKLILVEDRTQGEVARYLTAHSYDLIDKVSHHDFLFRDCR